MSGYICNIFGIIYAAAASAQFHSVFHFLIGRSFIFLLCLLPLNAHIVSNWFKPSLFLQKKTIILLYAPVWFLVFFLNFFVVVFAFLFLPIDADRILCHRSWSCVCARTHELDGHGEFIVLLLFGFVCYDAFFLSQHCSLSVVKNCWASPTSDHLHFVGRIKFFQLVLIIQFSQFFFSLSFASHSRHILSVDRVYGSHVTEEEKKLLWIRYFCFHFNISSTFLWDYNGITLLSIYVVQT